MSGKKDRTRAEDWYGKRRATWKGRIVYYRKPHKFTSRDVFRVSKSMLDEAKAVDVANIAAAILVLMNSLSKIGWFVVIQNMPDGPEKWLLTMFQHVADLVRAGSVALASWIVDMLFTIFTKKPEIPPKVEPEPDPGDTDGPGITV